MIPLIQARRAFAPGGGGGDLSAEALYTDTYLGLSKSTAIVTTPCYVVVGFLCRSSFSRSLSCTVNGSAATELAAHGATNTSAARLWGVRIDTGTTANVVISASGSINIYSRSVIWSVINLLSDTPIEAKADAKSTTISAQNKGIVLGLHDTDSYSSPCTWTGLDEDFDLALESGSFNRRGSGASRTMDATDTTYAVSVTNGSASSDRNCWLSMR